MMVAGSIPGSTRTLAVAIYSFAETGRDTRGRAAGGGLGGARLSGPVAVELDHRARRSARMITLTSRCGRGHFELRAQERLAVRDHRAFGPSGSGKTTTLDAIAGLRAPAQRP